MTPVKRSRDRLGTALSAVLVVKAQVEERWWLQQHPGYADYRARTRRFLPFIV